MSNQATSELLSIGTFAKAVGLSVSAVRFYADRGLLLPAHIDNETGYRSFTAEQIDRAVMIRNLRVIGLPLTQVHAALQHPTDEAKQLVAAHIESLEASLHRARVTAEHLSTAHAADPTDSQPTKETTMAMTELIDGLEQVLPFASTDAELPHLMSVLIEAKAGSVRLVTTDTYRLAVRDLAVTTNGDDFSALIAAETVRRSLPALQSLGTARMSVEQSSLLLEDAQRSVALRCVPASFPDYEEFLARVEASTSIVAGRRELVDAFAHFANDSEPVTLEASGDGLRVCRADDAVVIACEQSGPTAAVVIDPALASECVSSAISDDVVIEIDADPLKAVAFRSALSGTYVSLLMPVKV